MKSVQIRKKEDEAQIEQLRALGAEKIDIWRYYAERADKLSDQLWITGTWLLGIIAAVLALPFAAGYVNAASGDVPLINNRPLVLTICGFGLLLCAYSYVVVQDLRDHIVRNWERADLLQHATWIEGTWVGRKLHAWRLLMTFQAVSMLAFLLLTIMALVPKG